MKIILTGATGYVGEGVLLQCLADTEIDHILSISRRPCGHQHSKLEEYLVDDLLQLQPDDERLQGYEALFFCAGISSVGLSEEQFRPIAYDIPMHLARILPQRERMTYIFVSGAGTGSSRQMWGKVKRQTEHDLQQLGFRHVFNFRPAMMKPMPGQLHMKRTDRIFGRLYPLFRLLGMGNTLQQVGRAMTVASARGYSRPEIEVRDIARLAQ